MTLPDGMFFRVSECINLPGELKVELREKTRLGSRGIDFLVTTLSKYATADEAVRDLKRSLIRDHHDDLEARKKYQAASHLREDSWTT